MFLLGAQSMPFGDEKVSMIAVFTAAPTAEGLLLGIIRGSAGGQMLRTLSEINDYP